MKTAEEWKAIWKNDPENYTPHDFEAKLTQRIEEIQLDAWKQGMDDAEDICNKHDRRNIGPDCAAAAQEISETRDRKPLFTTPSPSQE